MASTSLKGLPRLSGFVLLRFGTVTIVMMVLMMVIAVCEPNRVVANVCSVASPHLPVAAQGVRLTAG